MGNPLYNQLNSNSQATQFNSFMQNPMKFLANRNMNIPEQYANNPQAAVQYLLNSGRITQQQLNSVIQKAQQLGFKL